jgi:hypothetical protein
LLLAVHKPLTRALTRQGFDTAHARGNCTFADDAQNADVAQCAHMGAAAKFDRESLALSLAAHRKHANLFAILLTKQRHGPCGNRILRAHQTGADNFVAANFRVHFRFDRRNILGRQSSGLRKVKTQPFGRNKRTLLRHMPAQAVAQPRAKVRCRVVRTDRIATRHIDRQGHRIAHLDCAAFNLAAMGVQSASGFAVSLMVMDRPSAPVIVPASPI